DGANMTHDITITNDDADPTAKIVEHSKPCCGHLVDSPSLTVCLDLPIICNEILRVFIVKVFLTQPE
ncbi:MAG TPA: hypothetical protein QF487_05355, partial [Acidimicrobiales bacterium]|nr:hypothetical protein [Acidimicrobiales bacterium]